MKFATVCSGIEAATLAWKPLGWEPVFYSEIAAFPRAVLLADILMFWLKSVI